MTADREHVEEQVRSCYSTWGDRYYDEYYGPDAPYPPVHRDLVIRLLQDAKCHTVLDAGCGPASMMRDLLDAGLDVRGFDLTDEMVSAAKRALAERGDDEARVWQGSVLDADSYVVDGWAGSPPDAAICVGVLPHVPDGTEAQVVRNLAASVKPGGTVIIEARNELFALFTMNRFSADLLLDRLVPRDRLREIAGDREAMDEALEQFRAMFRLDLPPIRTGVAGEPGYDEVTSRVHNPFELRQLCETAGLHDVSLKYYHYHALPPMFLGADPEAAQRASLELEDPDDWRGTIMASAFFVVGTTA